MLTAITSFFRSQCAADNALWVMPLIGAVFAVIIVVTAPPSPFDKAVVVRVCHDGSRVFFMEDGKYRVRGPGAWRSFRAAGANVCQ
jgi:hypothetical protein